MMMMLLMMSVMILMMMMLIDDNDDNDDDDDDDNVDDDDDDDDNDEAHLAVSSGWKGWPRRLHQKVQGPTLSLCTYTPSHNLDGCDHQHWRHSVTASIDHSMCHTVITRTSISKLMFN